MPQKSTKEMFIRKSINIHGDEYDYSMVNYINNKTKVKIICKKHGIFEQRPDNHIQNQKCPYCINNNIKSTNEEFIRKSIEKYGHILDYSMVDYVNVNTKVKFICKKHGVFYQIPNNHLCKKMKIPCYKCSSEDRVLEKKEIILKLNNIHNGFYNYSKFEYFGYSNKSIIICPIHGEFTQKVHTHFLGSGCKKCSSSNGEKMISSILNDININYLKEHKFNDCKDKIELKFDFYIPQKNICIEYNGLQHYKEINFFGGEVYFNGIKRRDEIKLKYCKENNIQLIIFKYNEDKQRIKHLLFNILKS